MGFFILLVIIVVSAYFAVKSLGEIFSPQPSHDDHGTSSASSRVPHDSKEVLELKRRMQKMAERQGFVITGWGDVYVEEDGKLGIECYTHIPDGKEGEYVDNVQRALGDNLSEITIIPGDNEDEPQEVERDEEKDNQEERVRVKENGHITEVYVQKGGTYVENQIINN